jgi:hypothetical protein
MITELFVENYQVDITSDIDAMMTYAIDDIKDFSARNTSFSKTIVIPGTANNNNIFGNVFDPNQSRYSDPNATNINYNFDISRSASCILFQGNMQVFKGIIRILQIVIDKDQISYECSLFGELGGLILALGTKKIEELDFSLYDIVYDINSITNSWDPANQSYAFDSGPFGVDFVLSTLRFYGQDLTAYLVVGQSVYINAGFFPAPFYLNTGSKTIVSFSYNSGVTEIVFTAPFTTSGNGSAIVSVTGQPGLGIHFPLIDYGTYSADKVNWDYLTFRPALFVYEYIKKIFEGLSYKYNAPFFEQAFFKTLIIPHNQKVLTGTKTNIFTGNRTDISFSNPNGTTVRGFPIEFVSTSLTTPDNIVFTYTGTSSVFNVNFHEAYFIQTIGNGAANNRFRIKMFKRVSGVDTLIYETPQVQYPSVGIGGASNTFFFDFSIDFSLSTSESFWFALEIIQSSGSSQTTNFYTPYSTTYIKIDSLTPIVQPLTYGNFITINDTIPKNIMQKDFLSSIMKMFNLYLYEDNTLQKMIKITPYVDFYDTNVNNALDWTYKMDVGKPLVLKPMSELNARYYLFKYKDDSDYYNEQYKKRFNLGYGTNKFDTGFEFAKEETSVDLIFSSTPLVGYETGGKVYPTIFKRTGDVVGAGEETMDHNIRIMQKKLITGVASYDITQTSSGTTSTLTTKTEYPYAGHFNDPYTPTIDINYAIPSLLYYQPTNIASIDVNLFTLYWIQYMYEIIDQDSRLLVANFRLNEQDINQLDFSKLIYIQGVLYRLNKIIDYNATQRDTCKVELLKVINKNY